MMKDHYLTRIFERDFAVTNLLPHTTTKRICWKYPDITVLRRLLTREKERYKNKRSGTLLRTLLPMMPSLLLSIGGGSL